LMRGSEKQFEELFRMKQPDFHALVSWLRDNCGLEGTQYQSAAHAVRCEHFTDSNAVSQVQEPP
jgi:hypothetical protein